MRDNKEDEKINQRKLQLKKKLKRYVEIRNNENKRRENEKNREKRGNKKTKVRGRK